VTKARFAWRHGRFVIVALLLLLLGWMFAFREPDLTHVRIATRSDLERELETLRGRLRIPGMSAAIAERDRIVWTRGFGLADVERGVAAGPDTIYHLASLTNPYASLLSSRLSRRAAAISSVSMPCSARRGSSARQSRLG
jgi:CubicO group peptidase (beta-lactamase class C family)